MTMYSTTKLSLYACAAFLSGCLAHPAPEMRHQAEMAPALPPTQLVTPQHPLRGLQRVLLVIGHWDNGETTDPDVQWSQLFGEDPESLKSWVKASSEGQLELQPVSVPASIREAGTAAAAGNAQMLIANFGKRPPGNCDYSDMLSRAREAATEAGIQTSAYDFLFVAVKCQGGALADVPGRTIVTFGQGGSPHVWRHEFGHNLGTSHPGMYYDCPLIEGIIQAPDHCTVRSTYDPGDPTGGGITYYPAVTRMFADWLDKSRFAALTGTGLYRLANLGDAGPQLYLYRKPSDKRFITFEYRRDDETPEKSGIWVRYSAIGGSIKSTLLNARPKANARDQAAPQFTAGQLFEDKVAQLKVKVCTTDDAATLAVAMNSAELPACNKIAAPALLTPAPGGISTTYPVFSGTGIPGAEIKVVKSQAPETVIATTQVDAHGNWSVLPYSELPQGGYSVSVRQHIEDAASSWSPNVAFTIEKLETIPQPQIEAPAVDTETGLYPIISGTALPGAMVRVTRSHDPGGALGKAQANANGEWAVPLTQSLPEGNYSVSATQTLANMQSAWSANRRFKVIAAIEAPLITEPQANAQTGNRPLISGTALPGAIVTVYRSNQPGTVLGSASVDASGYWSIRVLDALPSGDYSISSRQNVRGNLSAFSLNVRFKIVDDMN
ncbi:hypothetical protein ACIPZ5_11110 [Pseudomonas sp. NPDC089428]|uniref:hypothetical protein n=1 Tax=Pseudomonas sp. NPDC089428 TaxID=3364467 RepID=UPI00381E4EA9